MREWSVTFSTIKQSNGLLSSQSPSPGFFVDASPKVAATAYKLNGNITDNLISLKEYFWRFADYRPIIDFLYLMMIITDGGFAPQFGRSYRFRHEILDVLNDIFKLYADPLAALSISQIKQELELFGIDEPDSNVNRMQLQKLLQEARNMLDHDPLNKSLSFTSEQMGIFDCNIVGQEVLKIEAMAGTGKTVLSFMTISVISTITTAISISITITITVDYLTGMGSSTCLAFGWAHPVSRFQSRCGR